MVQNCIQGGCKVRWFTFCITMFFLQIFMHLHTINMSQNQQYANFFVRFKLSTWILKTI
jgi:hypothetical protein